MLSTEVRVLESLPFGTGRAVLDPVTGAPAQFLDDRAPVRRFLLEQAAAPWHSVEHQWGSGHLVTDRGAARWLTPSRLRASDGTVEVVHTPLPGIRVEVRRSVQVLRERYTVLNSGDEPLAVTGLGIRTSFADWYGDAQTSLEEAVRAHVLTGGTWSRVPAQPMSGEGRCLGLIVREGAVRAYSVESRNQASLSDVRGHLVLQVTDHARNPDAFGGQPVPHLAPGESTSVAWELGWYESVDDFTAATRPPAVFSAYAAETGTPIVVNGTSGGGALASILGASGNSGEYTPYLAAIGAAGIGAKGRSTPRDDVFAVNA
ncbi:hypothetical protein GCM10019016_104040 [Streptomyces prasinosporus]|uniref:Uncharacterized protein n=1 Tax=Streptomyces prasinosporus TaxID=68256 RepID=A0ABP6U786_9ACTN